jgi:hypothetical protein
VRWATKRTLADRQFDSGTTLGTSIRTLNRRCNLRLIRFAEAYGRTQSMAYDMAADEFDLDDADKERAPAFFFPLAS